MILQYQDYHINKNIYIDNFVLDKEHVIIKGVNGSGKTTFIQHIFHTLEIKPKLMQLYGFINIDTHQNINLISDLSIYDFIYLYIAKPNILYFFTTFCEYENIKIDINNPIRILSLGQYLSLMVYIYIFQKKKYIIMDEVLNSLTLEDSIKFLTNILNYSQHEYYLLIAIQNTSPSLDIVFNNIFKDIFSNKYVFQYNSLKEKYTLNKE